MSRILITGATSGLGLASARKLAELGHDVVLHGRNEARLAEVLEELTRAGHAVSGEVADLADLDQVEALAERVAAGGLDVLMNNAGGYQPRRKSTVQGHEWSFGVNYLAPVLLTRRLIPTLQEADAGRVIMVASRTHKEGRLDLKNIKRTEGRYHGYGAYADSKLAGLLFTRELAERLGGGPPAVHAVEPGIVSTGFGQDEPGFFQRLYNVGRFIMRSPEKGARGQIELADGPARLGQSGSYWVDGKVKTPSKRARDPKMAANLWAYTCAVLGLDLWVD